LITSRTARQLAKASNITLQNWALCGTAVAQCGNGNFSNIQQEVEQLVQETWLPVPVWGFIQAIWAVYCYHEQRYEQAFRLVNFLFNSNMETFQWASHWPLLQQIEADLNKQMDKTIGIKLSDEGRQFSMDEANQLVLDQLQ